MGWLRRSRGRGRHAAASRSGTWMAPARPVDPVLPEPPVAVEMPVAVELGFRDGSSLRLGIESPHARALRAVADVLVRGDR